MASSQGWLSLLHDGSKLRLIGRIPSATAFAAMCSTTRFLMPLPSTAGAVHDDLYTTSSNGEGSRRVGFRPQGIAFYAYKDPKPGAIPLYRFYDPVRHQHFYTIHPHAEFAK